MNKPIKINSAMAEALAMKGIDPMDIIENEEWVDVTQALTLCGCKSTLLQDAVESGRVQCTPKGYPKRLAKKEDLIQVLGTADFTIPPMSERRHFKDDH